MINANWGLRPILFEIGGFSVESYPVMVFIALLVGVIIYIYQLKKDNIKSSNSIYIAIFAIVGGTIGAKLPIIFMYWKEINSNPNSLNAILQGRTILGGLIGGTIGVFLAKKMFKIEVRMGNQLAIPIAVGMSIGRIGCLLRGCCYGKPTSLIWGIDFGDHILRHPTQIYEMIFDLVLAFYLYKRKEKGVKPGELYTLFLNYYLSFRFLLEFIRVEKISIIGLTDFQLLCVVCLIFINRKFLISLIKRKEVNSYE